MVTFGGTDEMNPATSESQGASEWFYRFFKIEFLLKII